MVSVGDAIRFDGFGGTVRAVVSTTDADGRFTITYGTDFRGRVLRCPQVDGTDYPLTTGGAADPRLRIGVVQRDDNPVLFALALDDGPAPDGAGMFVQGVGGTWAEALYYSSVDSIIFTTGAWYKATIKKGGVAQASVLPDLELVYSTSDGTQHTYFPPGPHPNTWGGQPDGCFITDVNGLMLRSLPNGATEPVIIGRGVGALGHRAGDTWVSGPLSERLLSGLKVWYLGEYVEAVPNGSVTLDIASCQLTITGPAAANCTVQWEEGQLRLTPATTYTLDGSGSVVITGLPPGKYSVDLEHPTDNDKGLAKQEITLTNGQSGTVAFGGAWNTVTAGWTQFYVYRSGGTALAGATLYQKIGPSGQEVYTAVATSGADGSILIFGIGTGADDQIVKHDEWGAVCITQASSVQWINVTLAGRFSGLRSAQQGEYQEGIIPWGPNSNHPNLPAGVKAGYAQDTVTLKKYYFRPASGGYGTVSDPCPRGSIEGAFDPANWTVRQYNICSADGTVLLANQTLPGDTTGRWTDALLDRRQTTVGRLLTVVAGGKISGNLVEYAPSQRITTADLTEAARQGLEHGKFVIPLEARTISATVDAANGQRYTTFCSWQCPYCGAACWDRPDAGSYVRGFCPVCALNGYPTVDLRTYLVTPTLAALLDWRLTIARNTTAGGHAKRLVAGWPRPAEYYETDAYLATIDGLSRWKAVHIILGWWLGGAFVDGESIAQAEARVGQTIGPVQLKLELNALYSGTGKTVHVTATNAYTGQAEVLTGTVPYGSEPGDIILLKAGPHDAYPGWNNWYTDVTGITVEGDGDLRAKVVNDGPSWRSSAGVAVTHWAYSPYACDVWFGGRWPFLLAEPTGIMQLAFCREGGVFLAEKQFGQQFGTPRSVSVAAGYGGACERPCVARLYAGGGLLVSADDGAQTRFWVSKTNGDSWQQLTVIPPRYCEFRQTGEGLLQLVGLLGGNLVYSYSDDNGFTWTAPVTIAAVDATRPPSITIQAGQVFVQAYLDGFTRTWRSRMGGDTGTWEFVGTVGA